MRLELGGGGLAHRDSLEATTTYLGLEFHTGEVVLC